MQDGTLRAVISAGIVFAITVTVAKYIGTWGIAGIVAVFAAGVASLGWTAFVEIVAKEGIAAGLTRVLFAAIYVVVGVGTAVVGWGFDIVSLADPLSALLVPFGSTAAALLKKLFVKLG